MTGAQGRRSTEQTEETTTRAAAPRTRCHPAALLPSPWPLPKVNSPPTRNSSRTSEGCPRISTPASKSHRSQRPKRVWGRGQRRHFPCLYYQEVKGQEGPSGVKEPSGLHLEDTREAAEARAPQERGVWEGSSPRTPWGGGQAWGHLATSGALICLETALPELRTPSPGSRSVCQVLNPTPLQGSSSWRPPHLQEHTRIQVWPGAWGLGGQESRTQNPSAL